MKPPADARTNHLLAGITVLVTRAGEDAAALREPLNALGATVIELPMIAIESPEDVGPLDAALARLDQFDWIVFASRHAVHAVCDRLQALDLHIPVSVRIAAVGPSTASELDALDILVSCRPAEATARDLVVAMTTAGIAGCRILLPTGDRARPELRDGLRRAGAVVEEILAYRTVQPLEVRRAGLDVLRRGGVDVVTLASPSAIHNLTAVLGSDRHLLRYPRLVCIGPTTAAAVREYGLEPAAVAADHTMDGLITTVVHMMTGEDSR